MTTLIVVLVIIALLVVAGVVMAKRVDRSSHDAVDRVRVQSQVRQTRLMADGPSRDVALLRQRLDAQLRAARAVLESPDGEVFRADGPTVLAEVTKSAHELDASLVAIGELTEAQQREALPAITAQVDQLIDTTDTACRTLLRTRAKTRSGELDALSSDIDFEAASLATYERERNDLTL
ncbi:hypothetical protein [uncultured Jatrophihabitans sp.]|uniref:hypothetical protein n=1 Tax=uncultured Jatrophihabitans sp. TaxID=1610747 RepID=UPI0035CB50F0